jgi:hypothetical protein
VVTAVVVALVAPRLVMGGTVMVVAVVLARARCPKIGRRSPPDVTCDEPQPVDAKRAATRSARPI